MCETTSWFVYIVKCRDETLYTGITTNLEERLLKHNSGKGARYTRGRGPVELVYSEELTTKSAALIRELKIKTLSKVEKEKIINT